MEPGRRDLKEAVRGEGQRCDSTLSYAVRAAAAGARRGTALPLREPIRRCCCQWGQQWLHAQERRERVAARSQARQHVDAAWELRSGQRREVRRGVEKQRPRVGWGAAAEMGHRAEREPLRVERVKV